MDLNKLIIELKEKAAKATRGPWRHRTSGEFGSGVGHSSGEFLVETKHNHQSSSWSRDIAVAAHGYSYQNTGDNWKNMDYIATASPDLITELCTALEEAREACNYVVEHEKSNLEYNPNLHRHDRYRENMYWKARAFIEKWGEK